MRRLITFVLLMCVIGFAAGCGGDDKPTAPKASTPKIAYLHRPIAGYNHPAEFKSYLDAVGYPTTLLSVDTVTSIDWTGFTVIVIDDRVAQGFEFGTQAQVDAVRDAGLPILGAGLGGYAYFAAIDTTHVWIANGIIYVDSSNTQSDQRIMRVADTRVDTSEVVFRSPVDILLPTDSTIQIQPRGYASAIVPAAGLPDTVQCLGRVPSPADRYSAMRLGSKAYFFGYGGSMELMTTSGRFLFTNMLYDLTH